MVSGGQALSCAIKDPRVASWDMRKGFLMKGDHLGAKILEGGLCPRRCGFISS